MRTLLLFGLSAGLGTLILDILDRQSRNMNGHNCDENRTGNHLVGFPGHDSQYFRTSQFAEAKSAHPINVQSCQYNQRKQRKHNLQFEPLFDHVAFLLSTSISLLYIFLIFLSILCNLVLHNLHILF